jgi:copper(I)-binding protein
VSTRLRLGALALIALVVVAGAGIAVFGDGGDGDSSPKSPITVTGQYVTETENDVAALYFTIKNSGAQDTLLSVSTDASPDSSIHQDVTQGLSSSMQLLQDLVIPANGELTMKPGAYHVMITGITKPLTAGTQVAVHLTLQKNGTIDFTAPVKSRD